MAAKSIKTARAKKPLPTSSPFEAATIVDLPEPGRAEVRVRAGDGRTAPAPARVAQIAGYAPSPGDRVLVARAGDDLYVVAVLHAKNPLSLACPDGARAELREGALELRDPAGRLLVRYADGAAEIAAPARDLVLTAPHGRVVVSAGLDVSIEAARDLHQHAARRVDVGAGDPASGPKIQVDPAATRVKASRLEVEARASQVATGEAEVVARSIATTAERLAHRVDHYELTATKIVEKARDAFRDVTGLLQARLGRARTLVEGVYTLHTRRSVLQSKEDTTIDGERVLLG